MSAIVNLIYLSARDKYRVEREDKAGEGYVDFIFYPERKKNDAIILELKIDSTPEEAITQIKEKSMRCVLWESLENSLSIPEGFWQWESVIIRRQKSMHVKLRC